MDTAGGVSKLRAVTRGQRRFSPQRADPHERSHRQNGLKFYSKNQLEAFNNSLIIAKKIKLIIINEFNYKGFHSIRNDFE